MSLEAVGAELHTMLTAVDAAGFVVEAKFNGPVAAAITYGHAFAPYELGSSSNMQSIPDELRPYYHQTLRPALRAMSQAGHPEGMAIAHSAGRLAGACIDAKIMTVKPPLVIANDFIKVRGDTHPPLHHTITHAVDYGMGVNGLIAHRKNLERQSYTVTGLQKEPGEAEFIRGVASFWGIQDALTIRDGGLRQAVNLADDPAEANQADLIIAGRVHMAEDLPEALEAAPRLLSPEGVLIALGPIEQPGFNYDDVANILRLDARLNIQANRLFYPYPGNQEQSRLLIARPV